MNVSNLYNIISATTAVSKNTFSSTYYKSNYLNQYIKTYHFTTSKSNGYTGSGATAIMTFTLGRKGTINVSSFMFDDVVLSTRYTTVSTYTNISSYSNNLNL